MDSIAPIKSRMPRCISVFMYQSAPVWHFGVEFFGQAEQKLLELSEPEHFSQQAARSR